MKTSATTAADIRTYLHEVLGAPIAEALPWRGAGSLPFYLGDAFGVHEYALFGQPILLAIDQRPKPVSLSEVAQWMSKLRALASLPVLYVTAALASWERRRLIEQKVAFAVPGNQLYLPDLGLDLREHFRRATAEREVLQFSPSTQAMLFAHLLAGSGWDRLWQPVGTARQLGYTSMTASRAVSELIAAGVGERVTTSKVQRVFLAGRTPREVWAKAEGAIRSPVQKTVWVRPPVPEWRLAGLSALSRRSMVNEPRCPVYAVERQQWLQMETGLTVLPESDAAAAEVQIWRYATDLKPEGDEVDPLSLIASLKDDPDERVQGALEELKEQIAW